MIDRMDEGIAPVCVVGAGSIGTAWAIVFAVAGVPVRLFDTDPNRLDNAKVMIAERLDALAEFSLIDEAPDVILARVETTPDMDAFLDGAWYVQENVPEDIDLKKRVLADIGARVGAHCVIASSSSFIGASRMVAELPGRDRYLVVHPGNPPYLLRVVEIVPAPFTSPSAVERATALMSRCDMAPILVKREVEGFVFNRLQGALLREAYCLVRDGVASVNDIDALVRDGLGFRWALLGPFESVDLNTRGGIEGHAARMGPSYERMGAERGQHDPWTPDLVGEVTAARRAALPLDHWDERTAWRDRNLMALLRTKQTLKG